MGLSIVGVQLQERKVNIDDRGYLVEILRVSDPHFRKFGQVYLVGDLKAGTIRAWHKHSMLWDYFHITHGAAKFALHDDRGGPTHGVTDSIVVSARNPATLVVPPGVYHGWMALEDDTQLISVASELYDHANPDEVRVPWDSFGYDWRTQYK